MEKNKEITIAVGAHADSLTWKNKKLRWEEFTKKLSQTTRTPETLAEYQLMTKKERGRVKDVGGYVGGHVKGGRRKLANIAFRSLLTLDIDYATMGFWDDFTFTYENVAAAIHATHTHTESSPRLRLIIPLSRNASIDEYEAVARRVASELDINQFDPTTFEPQRLMYWPSTPTDLEYYYREQRGEPLDVDAVLASYVDWKDVAEWPSNDRQEKRLKSEIKKIGDPRDKKGLIGIFCRKYDIHDAIAAFLPEVYEQLNDSRYTYVGGTTAGGMVVYDDVFAFSHHSTDPCSGKLVNAYDLVRINLFSNLDEGEEDNRRSNSAMLEFLQNDEVLMVANYEERVNASRSDFEQNTDAEPVSEADLLWSKELEVLKTGEYASSAKNIACILKNDPHLKGAFAYNEFDNRRYLKRSVPWRRIDGLEEPLKEVDYAGVRSYLETVYNIVATNKIEDGLTLVFSAQSFNPVRDYLDGLEWDGVSRIERLLVDYFGADDNIYTREAIRKTLTAAVARIYEPGIKFDLVLTLVGEQGEGKSRFFDRLGGRWFSDTFTTVQGKEAFEQIQGAWIVEMAELSGLRKAEVESIKHFLTKREDRFRPAYARVVETYKRMCVFVATTNSRDFLRDPSGNRRFMPIDVIAARITKSVHSDEFAAIIPQIWAEAKNLYENGETLYLSKEAETIANEERILHSETDERRGLIEHYLDTLLPLNWGEMDLFARRAYVEGTIEGAKGVHYRTEVCIAEVWCECLGKDKEEMSRYSTKEINDIMRSMSDWSYIKNSKNFKGYGRQRYYLRKVDREDLM